MTETQTKDRKITYKDVLRFSWHYWQRQKIMGMSLIALMMLATLIDSFVPVYTGKIIDSLVSGAPGDGISMNAALRSFFTLLALAFCFHTLRWASISLWAKFALYALHDILTEAMQKVQRFSSDWHANAFAGGTVRKITRGMWAFDVYGDTLLMGLLPAAIITFGMTAMLVIHVPIVGLFTGAMVVVYTVFSIVTSVAYMAPLFKNAARSDTKVGATLADIITGNATVKSFGAETREEALFRRVARLWKLRSQKAWVNGEMINLLRNLLRVVMYSGMIGLTILMWNRGQASPGDIGLALSSYFIIAGYLRDIGMHIAHLQRSVSEMEDVITFWLREDDVRDKPQAKSLAVTDGEIAFDHVKFLYRDQASALFDDLSLTIRPGEHVALVGPSGSGKSSFVKLVQRLYDVSGGEIRIDGQNIANVTQDSLRRHIALVPQDPMLFHRSIAANIAYGRPGARMTEIIDAAKQAYIHDFIETLPQGYRTLVGERGIKLSGGERQRVAIARAILANAPILIMDEATSSLDSISEHFIQKALVNLMQGRTTITIAHRLSTIRTADRILVFEKGRIVEQGRHEDLAATPDSSYRKLYAMQTADYAV